jgi:hypothetical protein
VGFIEKQHAFVGVGAICLGAIAGRRLLRTLFQELIASTSLVYLSPSSGDRLLEEVQNHQYAVVFIDSEELKPESPRITNRRLYKNTFIVIVRKASRATA